MRNADTLVSVGLPIRNGADRVERIVSSVLSQDHENLELVVCDNDSDDGTSELCRDLAAQDSRIIYHRHPINVGLFKNFVGALQLGSGTFFRWVSDDDWLDPRCISRSLDVLADDDRLLMVTTQISYTGDDGVMHTAPYHGTALGSDDPIARFTEMLRLLNESYLLIDPLYGLFRRKPVLTIDRRNMLREDEVFATKLALAGPWGHVPEVLARRQWKDQRASDLARTLDVPRWRAHFRTMLQCREMLLWLDECDLDPQQRRSGRLAVARMYMRRQQLVVARGGRKVKRLAQGLAGPLETRPTTADQSVAADEHHIP